MFYRRCAEVNGIALVVRVQHSQRTGHGSAYATVSDPTMIGAGGTHRVPVITRVDQPLMSSSSPRILAAAKPSPHHRHHHPPTPAAHQQQQQQQQQQQPVAVMPGPLPTSLATTAAPPHDGKYHARRVDKLSRKCFPVVFTVFNVIYWVFYGAQSDPD